MKPHKSPPKPTSARAQAHILLGEVLAERRTLDEALAAHPFSGSDADQRFAVLLTLTVLRHLGQLDAVIAHYLDKPLPAKRIAITNALRLGAAQLLLLDTPAHAALNETVAVVKASKQAGLSGLVNAVLQKLARDKPALPEANVNLPAWLRTRWETQYGADAVAAMATLAAMRPPLDLNGYKGEGQKLDAFVTRLNADHPPVETLEGFADGAFFVQDVAASYPARLLGDVRERQVLDLCAAPGGKAMQLIRAGAFVTALDRSGARLRTLKENLKRMGMQANCVSADLLEWQPTRAYDAILLDAPCSATGTWRRHPEVVQIVNEADIAELASLQRQMLTRAWQWLKPGGRMVYCVCSLERVEGEAQAEWFMHTHADAHAVPVDASTEIPAECVSGATLRTLPHHRAEQGGMDGFFAVCFEKTVE